MYPKKTLQYDRLNKHNRTVTHIEQKTWFGLTAIAVKKQLNVTKKTEADTVSVFVVRRFYLQSLTAFVAFAVLVELFFDADLLQFLVAVAICRTPFVDFAKTFRRARKGCAICFAMVV